MDVQLELISWLSCIEVETSAQMGYAHLVKR